MAIVMSNPVPLKQIILSRDATGSIALSVVTDPLAIRTDIVYQLKFTPQDLYSLLTRIQNELNQ